MSNQVPLFFISCPPGGVLTLVLCGFSLHYSTYALRQYILSAALPTILLVHLDVEIRTRIYEDVDLLMLGSKACQASSSRLVQGRLVSGNHHVL